MPNSTLRQENSALSPGPERELAARDSAESQENPFSALIRPAIFQFFVHFESSGQAWRVVSIRMSDCRMAFLGRLNEPTAWKGRPTHQIMADTALACFDSGILTFQDLSALNSCVARYAPRFGA
ncbi:MAG: hypothetical protein R3C49_01340 [Planctomycetaceae bacterium]